MYHPKKILVNNRLIISVCLFGLLASSLTTVNHINQSTRQEKNTVAQPQPITAVTALGRIEPQGKIVKLSASSSFGEAKLAKLLVKEGDLVTEGQVIALLDNYQSANAAFELARRELRLAEIDLDIVKAGAKQGDIDAQAANLRRVNAQLEGEIIANEAEVAQLKAQLRTETAEKQATIMGHQAELRNAESEFKRYQVLAQEGATPISELDSRRLELETAQSSLAEAQASLNRSLDTLQQQINQAQAVAKQSKNTLQQQIIEAEASLASVSEVRKLDVIRAKADVERAIASLRQTEADRELNTVKAPTDGQIIKITTYPGAMVSDEGIVEFAQTNKMQVIAEVYESDISKVQVGQTATIRSETGVFAGEITGEVSQIGLKIGKQDILDTDPAADVDSRVIEVKINLDPETSNRISHLTNSKAFVKINL